MPASGTAIQCGGAMIRPMGPAGMPRQKPAFDVPRNPGGETPDRRADRARRVDAAVLADISSKDLPINHILAAGTKAAEGKMPYTFRLICLAVSPDVSLQADAAGGVIPNSADRRACTFHRGSFRNANM
jgi:hypothetical protein